MEIHLRSNKAKNCASILFNNMRIFCVMDWMISLKDYLSSNPEKLLVKQVPRYNRLQLHHTGFLSRYIKFGAVCNSFLCTQLWSFFAGSKWRFIIYVYKKQSNWKKWFIYYNILYRFNKNNQFRGAQWLSF